MSDKDWEDGKMHITEEASTYLSALAQLVKEFGRAIVRVKNHVLKTGEEATPEMVEALAMTQQALLLAIEAAHVDGLSDAQWFQLQRTQRALLLCPDPDDATGEQ